MGSEFVDKHKKKSALAALLLIFRGRVKYIGIALVVIAGSIPFVVSGETVNGLITLPGVSSFLSTIGLGGVVASARQHGTDDGLRAAIDRAASDSRQESLWAQFLKRVNAPMPPAGSQSSMAMLRGDMKDLGGLPQLKDGAERRAPGQVAGAVNDEERARGDTGEAVDMQGLLAKGGYGDAMGGALAGTFSEGAASASGPFLNRSMMNGPGLSAAGGASGMYARVYNESAGRVPVPSKPGKLTSKRMGKVSGFSWKNVGYRTNKTTVDLKLGNKRPMFQLAETFAMTGAAYKSKEAALEYQAAYTGSTYDGNDVSAPVLQTDSTPPAVPDTAFAGDLMNGVVSAQKNADACQKADGQYSPKISDDGVQLDKIANSLGKPPKCCSGGVGAWNSKISRLVYYCNDYNANSAALAAACQSKGESMDCNAYSSMHINPCSKWKCGVGIILAFLFAIFAIITFGASLVVLAIIIGSALLFTSLNGIITDFITGGGGFGGTSRSGTGGTSSGTGGTGSGTGGTRKTDNGN